MSLPNYPDRLREKIAVWMKRHYRLRQRQLKVVRLEDRRLPDASFALVGDILTVAAFDGATDAVDVSFDANNNEFQLELSSGTWLSENPGPLDPAVSLNGNVLTVALPSLSQLQIHGSGTPIRITDSGSAFSISQLTITGAADLVLDSGNDIDSISIEAHSLTLHDSDDLDISTLQVTDSVDLSVAGTVTNSADAQIEVGGHASFEASSIVLGQHAADHVDLSSVSVTATESVEIDIDSAVEMTGSSSAAELTLSSEGSIQLADTATLTVHGNTALEADEIDVRGEFHSGSLTFHSAGHVHIHESSEMTLIGQSSASSLALQVDGLLADTSESLLQVTGHAEMNADSITLGNGDIEIGSLQFESAGTITLLQESEVRLSGNSYTGSLVAEHAQLIGTGIIHNGIEISNGGLLGGWLNISGALTIGPNGVLSPGNSPGITTSGNLTLTGGSTLLIELDDDNSGGYLGAVAGVDYDQTQVTGTVTINSGAALNLQDLGSTQSLTGDVYVIVQNDGVDAIVGTFSGLSNGAVVAAGGGGGAYSIYYNGGTGNDIVLIRRPASLSEVYVSNTFVGLSNGASVADYDFRTTGNQAGVYGLNAFATIPEAITAVTAGGIIHVDQGTYLHTSTLAVNKTVTIDGQGMGLTNILKSGAPTGNFDEAIRITADEVILSDAKLGWQIHNTTDYQGYVVITTADFTSINRILFGSNATGEGYRSAVVFEGSGANGADGLEVSDSVFEGRWGRAAIRDGDSGSGQNILITRNEFREDHFRWGPIAIGPQDSAGTPNNFAFSGEISFNYFGNGLDTLDFQSLGNQNYTVTITNQGLTAAGLDIVHNTFDWNDSAETNANGVYAQPAGVYITPSLTQNTNQILIQNNIFNNFAYAGPQPGSTDPLWRPTGGVFGGALEFDGADDFGVWQSSLFDAGTAGTLNFWVQMHDTSRRNQFFEGPGNAGFEMQYRNTSGGQVYGRTTTVGGDNVIRSGPDGATLLNTWRNIQYTWDFSATNATGRMRLYIDGVESGYLTNFTPNDLTWASAVSTVNGLMNIGRDPGDTTRYFDGLMDDVGWFNSVLNSTDRTNIRTNGVSALATDARLVSHWDFNQSSGDIAVDNRNGIQLYLSTTGVVPTEFGAVFRPGQGQFGGALEFDGVDDFATFRSGDFNVGERGTLNFWVRMHDTSRRNQFFEGPDNAGLEFQFRNNSSGQVYGRTTTAGGDFVIRSGPDGATLLNSWRNIQYTWDFNATNAVGKMRIYVDGVESGYLAGSTPNDLTWTAITDTVNGLMNVGRDPGDLIRFFDGLLDDIAWYDQVLSVSDRSTIRTAGVSAHADLVAHWNLDDAIGTTEAAGNSGTNITLYVNQIAPLPPVSGYGVVTPLAAIVLNNVFYNDVAGTYADSNQVLHSSNITGPTANPFFAGDDPHTVFTGTTLAEFYRLRFGSSAAYQSTEFQASIATLIPHVGANQENPVAVGTEDILIAGTDFDDLVVITFTGENDGSFVFTRNVTGGTPDYVGTFHFIDVTSFTFDGYGADDVLIIIQPTATQGGLYSLSKGIAFHGDLQNSNGNALDSDGATGGDTLVLLTSANDKAIIDSVSYVLSNDDPAVRHQGTITVADGLLSTTITYTGTEPIRDDLIADARTFSFGSTVGGGTETINVSAIGDTVAMAAVVPSRPAISSRTLNNRIVSDLTPSISFANPRTQLTLNAGLGNDTININSLHMDYRAALAVNGDGGTDAVNLNSSLTLGNAVAGNTGNLTVNSETVVVANIVAINTAAESSGDGDIRFTSTGSVNIGTGASLTTNSGFVIVTTVDGDIDVDGTISTGSDNILLMANGAGRDVEITADVSSTSGHVTLIADDSVRLLPNVDVQTSNAGTLIIEATNGSITMDATAALTSANGGIRLLALNSITVGNITASNSHVSITSSAGSIVDAEINDSEADVVALGLRLQAALGIGTPGGSSNPIETTITTLSARAGSGGINILESNGLTVDDVTVTTQKVQTNNSTMATTDALQSDLVTTNAGSIVLRSTNGTITLNDGTGSANGIAVSANGAGHVLLQTISGAADIVVNGNVEAVVGHVSLFSSDDIDLNANVSTGGSGSAYLAAGNIGNDALTGIDMQSGTSIVTAGGNVRLTADRESDVLLGLINAGQGNVSVLAERSVLDSNVAALNIQANSARIVADAALSNASNQVGFIGGSETGNPDPNVNTNAIDLQVTTLAAQSATGIYLKEADGLSVDATPQIVVQSVNADASSTTQSDASLSDLVTTNNGPIKLQTIVGSLTLNDGDADALAVSASGMGDVLLQTLGSNGDVLISAAIRSITGNITINSADDIVVNSAITTGGAGTIYLVATNGATDATGSQIDGIALNFGVTSSSGDVLISSQNDVQQSALLSSISGDIGIIAARDVYQSPAGDVTTTNGNVLVQASSGNWIMNADATITAGGGDILGTAGTNITLGVISATNTTANRIALHAVGGSITDANVAVINIQETVAGATTSLSLRTGTITGGAGGTTSAVNNQALDINVDTVAANAATGIYLREVAAGGAITVDTASAVTVNINGVVRSDFDSSTTSVAETLTIASLEDLTSNGPIKLVAEHGTIEIKGGANTTGVNANGTGNVLLEARAANSDVIVNAAIASGGGHITLDAADDVDLNATLSTGGAGSVYISGAGVSIDATVTSINGDVLISSTQEISHTAAINSSSGDIGLIADLAITQTITGNISTASGDVLIEAGTNWTMANGTVITVDGGNFDGKALIGDIALGRINSTRVALTAGSDISDVNGTTLNVVGTSVSLRAGGLIGNHQSGNGTSLINANAIDTQVTTLAASAGTGIYIEELNSLTIDTVAAVSVSLDGPKHANFNSTTSDVSQARSTAILEDLTTTNNGPIKIVTTNGSLTVNGGSLAAAGVVANGTSDVLLEARGAGSDVTLNGDISSNAGDVTVIAADSVSINRDVTTNGSGTVFVQAQSGTITLTDGDSNSNGIQNGAGDILLQASLNITLNAELESSAASIGVDAGANLEQSKNITAGADVLLVAVQNITMHGSAVTEAGGGELIMNAGENISLGLLQATSVSLESGGSILDVRLAETTNIRAANLRMVAGLEIGASDPGSSADTNLHAIDTEVTNLAAQSAAGIHVQEAAAGGAVVIRNVASIRTTVSVERANFNSTQSVVTQSDNLSGLADLTTTLNGDIKIVAKNGSITINDGAAGVINAANSRGIQAHGSGDVLLEARGATSDVLVNSSIRSGSGHITLNSADTVDLNASLQTSGNGTVFIVARTDIDLDAELITISGDILVQAGRDLTQTDLVQSSAGDIGLMAGRNLLQSATGDMSTSLGNVLVEAETNWEMTEDTTITVGGGKVVGQAQSGRILLGVIELTNATNNRVALSAGSDLADANGAAINICELTVSSETSVSLRSGGAIGRSDLLNLLPGQNVNALDLNVDVVSASAIAGIYLREVAAGGGLTVSTVDAVSVSINGVQQSRFNSSSTNAGQNRTVASLEDLATSSGPVKLVTENGTIVLSGGTDSTGLLAGGSGDVLLEARGAGSDVVVDATISNGTGHVTLNATDHVDLNAALSTGGSGTVFVTGASISINADVTSLNGDVLISSTQGIIQTAAINSTSGDVGLFANLAITQTNSGDITTTSGDVVVEAGTDWTMSNGTVVTAGGGDFDGKALAGDIALGRINSERTALTASSDISDANSTSLNVVGTSLSLRAGGLIGNHDNANHTPLANKNAIDTQVTTLAAMAGTGIYIEEANSLTIDSVAEINVSLDGPVRSNFKSNTTDVSLSRSTAVLEDLTTANNGPIKIVTLDGDITVNGGTMAAVGISANGTGDILLEARGAGSDIGVNSDVISGTGHISLVAADSISIVRDVITGGAGSVLINASTGSITLTDADANITGIRTSSGDILLQAAQNVTLTANLESASGNIGVASGSDLQQNRNITAGGDILLASTQNITMAATAETRANGGELILTAGQDISLGLLQATNVSLNSTADILDARLAETTNVRATNLRMIAAGAIGDADSSSGSGTNLHAIDTEVTNLAGKSGTGIHVREVSAGGSVVVRDIAAISVNVTSGRVNFNSTRIDVVLTQRLSGLSDLTTTRNGDIKLLAENGQIEIQDGGNGVPQASDGMGVSGHGTGEILLESRGNASDVAVNSDLKSDSGHITVNAADDVNLTADMATSGLGTVYLWSQNNATDGATGIVMANGTSITTGGGNVRLVAGNESDIRLGLINAGTGNVSLNAERSVLDNNGSALNVQSDALRIVADAAISGAGSVISLNGNGGGIIGGPETGNGTPDANINALDLQVSTVAAQSADGIYLREADGLTIQSTGIILVEQSNFNSSTTTRTDASLSDLVTTDNGSIKLLSAQGTITVSDGDGDGAGIKADGTGNVLLQTQSATGDVIVDAAITSALGHLTLRAADDVDLNAGISTSGTGTVFITGDGVSIDSTTTTAGGDVLILSTQSLRQTALIFSASGNVGLIAASTIVQSDSGDITSLSGDVLIEAGLDWTMSTGTMISSGGGDFDGKSLAGDIALGQIRSARAAVTAGNDVSDANGTSLNMTGTSVTFRAGGQIGSSDPTNETGLTNLNAIDTQVSTLAALAGKGIFIEDADSLIIDSVAAVNVSIAGPKQANFNSSTTDVPQSRGTAILEDLTMTGVGEIRVTTVSDSITLNRGTAIAGDVLKDIAVYAPGGGKVSIQTATDIYVRGNIVTRPEGIVSTDPTTDGIRLIANSGDIVIGDPADLTRQIVISTDHDEVNGSEDTTDDVVDLIARVGQVGNTTVGGKILIQSPVTIRTEGGVAKKFGPRPDVGVPSTAFFQYVSNPLPLAIDNSPAAWGTGNAYINAFHVLIGQSGEENLTVDIDWQDPSEEPGVFNNSGTQTIAGNLGIYNQISSERIQQFLVEKGGPSTQAIDNNTNGQIVVGHLYTALDYTRFQQQQNRTTIIIDLSVSHHSSINLTASSIAQSGVTQGVPGLDAASTDISTTVSDRGFDTPDIFENAIASFKIPTVTPAPPALFTVTFVPRADRPFNVAPPENQAVLSARSTAEFGSGAVSGSVFSTEVYFQIRRQYETDGPAEVVVERITDSSLISSREAFEKFVEQNPELQDGAGYEIWLISETGGQKVERPIVEFEISGGQPGTMNDAEPEGSPAQQLKDLPFEQPAEADADPEAQDSEIPQASLDVDSATMRSAHEAISSEINNADRAVSTASGTEQETSRMVSEALNPSSVALAGLMVRRFRKRQQESAASQSTFSRAARFQRKHSSPNAEFEVRGSSDV
ncbi:MAG: hypothetical protein NT138_20430 [Planctomycetales bacterium]|nr:hypothetical protein [Planctomycetales bacterium]